METLKWQDSYSVGVNKIDIQHKGLLEIINKLIELSKEKPQKENCSEIITSLIHYAYTHFATEENFMAQAEYPDQQKHIIEHVDFIMKIMSLALKVESENPADREELLTFLKKWFNSHILGTDRYYIPYLAQKGIT